MYNDMHIHNIQKTRTNHNRKNRKYYKTKEKHLKSSFDRNITGFEKNQEATLSHLIRTSVYF